MRVFRMTYKDGGGWKRTVSKWYLEFRDHQDRVRRMPAFTDKRASEELGRKVERLVSLRVSGGQPDTTLALWLETIPTRLRTKLARIGLLNPQTVAASKPLAEHLADYEQSLLDKGNTTTHAHNTAYCVQTDS